jgi:hypothetical protein
MGLTRRRFFQALAASVVVAGVPLPIGMSALTVSSNHYLTDADAWFLNDWSALACAVQRTKEREAARVFNRAFSR